MSSRSRILAGVRPHGGDSAGDDDRSKVTLDKKEADDAGDDTSDSECEDGDKANETGDGSDIRMDNEKEPDIKGLLGTYKPEGEEDEINKRSMTPLWLMEQEHQTYRTRR